MKNDTLCQTYGGHNPDMTVPPIVIAEVLLGLNEALDRLERYPPRTPSVYDYPGPGASSAVTAEEIRRTRKVSSRISAAEGDWFIALSRAAPWTPSDADLRDADPGESGGLYDSMLHLYSHFAGAAPKGVNTLRVRVS